LDGIRGLMAFWVFFYHLTVACTGRIPTKFPGGQAVEVFMFLSGFLMAYHWIMREKKFNKFQGQTIDFYVRRFFRIAPLYYVLLTIAFLGQSHFNQMQNYAAINFPNLAAHYTFFFGFLPQYSSSNMLPDWSIGLEMQFYLIFPFLMLAIGRFGSFSTVLSLVLIAVITNKFFGLYGTHGGWAGNPHPSLILFRIDIFVGGMCFAFAYLYRNSIQSLSWLVLGCISIFKCTMKLKFFAFFIIFMLCTDPDRKEFFHRVMSGRVAKFMGDTSYSVYLSHNLIMFPILYILYQHQWFAGLSAYKRLSVAFVLIGVLVYAFSYFLFRLVELPGINFGRNFLKSRKL